MQFRFEVHDIFDIHGRGVVVLGIITSGVVRVGDTLELSSSSSKRSVVVASIEKFKEPSLQVAAASSDDVAIGLENITRDQVQRHDTLVGR